MQRKKNKGVQKSNPKKPNGRAAKIAKVSRDELMEMLFYSEEATDEDEEIEVAEAEEDDNDEGSVGTVNEEWADEWKVTSVQWW